MIIKPLITRLVKNWKGLRRVLLALPPSFPLRVFTSLKRDAWFHVCVSIFQLLKNSSCRHSTYMDVERFPFERFVSFYPTRLTIVNENTIFFFFLFFFDIMFNSYHCVDIYIFNRLGFISINFVKFNFDSIWFRSKV